MSNPRALPFCTAYFRRSTWNESGSLHPAHELFGHKQTWQVVGHAASADIVW